MAVLRPAPPRRVWRARLVWSAAASLAAALLINALWIHPVEPPAWWSAGWGLAAEGSGAALAAAKAAGPVAAVAWGERRVEPTRPDVIEAR